MISRVKTSMMNGIVGELVEVEADISAGLPSFDLTGNLGIIAREARERVRTALKNIDVILSPAKYTVNLAPANIRKEGGHFDLAIAISLMVIIGIIPEDFIEDCMFIGELSLDGKVNPVNAILPMVICAKENGCQKAFVPIENASEGAYVDGIEVYGVEGLSDCIDYFVKGKELLRGKKQNTIENTDFSMDFGQIKGQRSMKNAAMIAAASMHNLMLIGPPGAGKTMIASRLPSIMPPMTEEECLMVSKIYSVAGLLRGENSFIQTRPFRAPHHMCTPQSLIGGGRNPVPGEISLSQYGVLFMDELNLFRNEAIEALRQPLENHNITISRISKTVVYPADFMLVAAMNPCKCGYYPDRNKCHCSPQDIRQYFGRISRPIMDRFDLSVNVPRTSYEDICISENSSKQEFDGLDSGTMRQRVMKAIDIQKKRYDGYDFSLNSQIPPELIREFCPMTEAAESLLKKSYERFDLSARSYYRLIRVTRTIADLNNLERIGEDEISEAITYRITEW